MITQMQLTNTSIKKRKIFAFGVGVITGLGLTVGLSTSLTQHNVSSQKILLWDEVSQYFALNGTGTEITGFNSTGDYELLKRCVDENIVGIKLGNSTVTSIGTEAFAGCASFCSKSCLTTIDLSCITDSIGNKAFCGCANLSFIKLRSINFLGQQAFYGCEKLTIPISDVSIGTINDESFAKCPNLTYDMIDNLSITTTVAHKVHNGKQGVAWVNSSSDEIAGTAIVGSLAFGNLGSYTNYVAAGTIIDNAFIGCASITSIDLESSNISIGEAAFAYCTNTVFSGTPTFTMSGGNQFAGCEKLTSSFVSGIIVNGCKIVPNSAAPTTGFAWIPNSKTTDITSAGCLAWGDLGNYSQYVTNLTSNTGAFNSCSSITDINLGISSTILDIGQYAFYYCTNIVFSGTPYIIKISPYAFTGCKKISWQFINGINVNGCVKITNRAATTMGIAWVPHNMHTEITTFGSLAWGDLGDYSYYISSIGDLAFYGCLCVTNINLKSNPIGIGKNAFRDDYNLTIHFI